MKYCPNADCPYLREVGFVAEYEDGIDLCADCGTALVAGDAPETLPSKQGAQAGVIGNRKLATVTTVDSLATAEWLKEQLAQVGIASSIVASRVADGESGDETPDGQEAAPESSAAHATSMFDLQVFADQALPALQVINEAWEEEIGKGDDDEFAEFLDEGDLIAEYLDEDEVVDDESYVDEPASEEALDEPEETRTFDDRAPQPRNWGLLFLALLAIALLVLFVIYYSG